ncbi:hypothetical protein CEXT_158901 [Caerostris extrusa]|uniref:Uncharacterized protein n=1 Tax=Caerostris extrusa TaxID=172846 RepID=A0AAV4MRA7_CAEEX|nr:hypothetical protein CEXT_158901 [Caerostris extrusa]
MFEYHLELVYQPRGPEYCFHCSPWRHFGYACKGTRPLVCAWRSEWPSGARFLGVLPRRFRVQSRPWVKSELAPPADADFVFARRIGLIRRTWDHRDLAEWLLLLSPGVQTGTCHYVVVRSHSESLGSWSIWLSMYR